MLGTGEYKINKEIKGGRTYYTALGTQGTLVTFEIPKPQEGDQDSQRVYDSFRVVMDYVREQIGQTSEGWRASKIKPGEALCINLIGYKGESYIASELFRYLAPQNPDGSRSVYTYSIGQKPTSAVTYGQVESVARGGRGSDLNGIAPFVVGRFLKSVGGGLNAPQSLYFGVYHLEQGEDPEEAPKKAAAALMRSNQTLFGGDYLGFTSQQSPVLDRSKIKTITIDQTKGVLYER